MASIKAISDLQEYERQQTITRIFTKLNEAEEVITLGNEWQTLNDLKNSLEV